MRFFLCLLIAASLWGGDTLYVANQTSQTISVLDVETNTFVATIPGGNLPVNIVVSQDGLFGYSLDANLNQVRVIDTTTNTVTATFSTGNTNPLSLGITPDGTKLYINALSDTHVSVLDAQTGALLNTVEVSSTGTLSGIAVASTFDGVFAYAVQESLGSVAVIDTKTDTVVATIDVGSLPAGVAISPSRRKGYVTNNGDSTVSVFDTETNEVLAVIPVGNSPTGLAISPNSRYTYVANNLSNRLSVIDNQTRQVIASVLTGLFPQTVAVTSDGSRVYVINENSNTLTVIDTSTNTVVTTLAAAAGPLGSFLSPMLNRVKGSFQKERFLTQTAFIVQLDWIPVESALATTGFNIYRDAAQTDLIASLPSTQNSYQEEVSSSSGESTFFVTQILGGSEVVIGSVSLVIQ